MAVNKISPSPNTPPVVGKGKWRRSVITVFAILYVISPLDLIPDWIPVIGWLDDLGVLAWAAREVFFKKDA